MSGAKRVIGLSIPSKENERRRALLPHDLRKMANADCVLIEAGYGAPMGIADASYEEAGARVASRAEVLSQPVVCTLKAPADDELSYMGTGQILFCWIHAVQGRWIVDRMMERRMTGIAWEDMHRDGRHVFWKNNEIAGYAAVLHASLLMGRRLDGLRAGLIGRGNIARGAYECLVRLGANVHVYNRATERLLREEIGRYDLVVNAVLWDVFRSDHIVYASDLSRMKAGAWILDISCDDEMGVETSHGTSIADPVFEVDGIWHYVVDHTPALLFRDATESVSAAVWPYLDLLAAGESDAVLDVALAMKDGVIVDDRVIRFQGR